MDTPIASTTIGGALDAEDFDGVRHAGSSP